MWPLLLSLLAATVFAIIHCGSDRQDVKRPPPKTAAGKSSRSAKTKKVDAHASMKKRHSSKSSKSRKSGKSGKTTSATSSKSKSKSEKSSKSGKDKAKKSRSRDLSATASTRSKDGSRKAAKLKLQDGPSGKSLKLSTESTSKVPTDSSIRNVALVELRADPAELTVPSEGGLQQFKFINDTNIRRCFKIKCSDNRLYRISPVYGIVEPRSFATIDVFRSSGAPKVDKLAIVTAEIGPEAFTPKNFPKDNSQVTVVPLFVDA